MCPDDAEPGRVPPDDVDAELAAAGLAQAFQDYARRRRFRPDELGPALSAWLTELIDEAERPPPEEPAK